MGKINLELAKEKGLINDNDLIYQKMVKDYKYLLEYYLSTIIDFSKYEDMIINGNLYIGKNIKYSESNEYLKLNYLFLVNNLFVEKLDETDLDLLKNFNKDNISSQLIDLVKRTYKNVIKDNYFKGEYTDQVYSVCYGPNVPYNYVKNDSLVFRFIYGKNLIETGDDKFIELDKKQTSFINDVVNRFKEEVYNKTGLVTEVLIMKDIYSK